MAKTVTASRVNADEQRQPSAMIDRSESLADLAVQGVTSRDAQLLERIFATDNEQEIRSAVARLPRGPVILGLIEAVVERIDRKPLRSSILLVWISTVLEMHASYLVSAGENPDTADSVQKTVAPLLRLCDARGRHTKRLMMLQGRLDLLLQDTSEVKPSDRVAVFDVPRYVYDDDEDIEGNAAFMDMMDGSESMSSESESESSEDDGMHAEMQDDDSDSEE